jgi:hypothetical protein
MLPVQHMATGDECVLRSSDGHFALVTSCRTSKLRPDVPASYFHRVGLGRVVGVICFEVSGRVFSCAAWCNLATIASGSCAPRAKALVTAGGCYR